MQIDDREVAIRLQPHIVELGAFAMRINDNTAEAFDLIGHTIHVLVAGWQKGAGNTDQVVSFTDFSRLSDYSRVHRRATDYFSTCGAEA